jgi:hypothetical protein
MKTVLRHAVVPILAGMCLVSAVRAQTAGNPVGTQGRNEWTLSASGVYSDIWLGSERSVSRRLLVKSLWGLTDWFDVFALAGGVQMDMKTQETGVQDYTGQYTFAWGGGVNVSLLHPSRSGIGIWLAAHVLRFPSTGQFQTTLSVEGEPIDRIFDMHYDSREFQAEAGITVPIRFFRVYVAGALWGVQRMDKKKEYLEYSSFSSYLGEVESEYRSGLWSGGILGIQIDLPLRYSVTIEGLIFNTDNYRVMVGVSQTGILAW